MDRYATPPFTVRLFYRTGAFHRPDEFTASTLPPHVTFHTWPDCNLTELTYHLASENTSALPNPAIGTRLVYRLIFPDTRGGAPAQQPGPGARPEPGTGAGAGPVKYMVKDLGSVVIGNGGAGLDPDDPEGEKELENEGEKTLGEARFVTGDFISCAILPALPDGSVAPASSARTGRGAGVGESRIILGRAPGSAGGGREYENGNPRFNRGRNSGRAYDGFGTRSSGIPMGEWRRGERLPDVPPSGRGRARGRY
ncbi:Sin3 associated polypeptide p18-domain-containing protein [Durotheca rogersii]|uniref:Sin3 associated polypeptide p18-domain-containing protein n=1 Tax=Durotheca rogersii TaxID=419775 RepID=UPI00221E604D|nr:Sin3 associated polypeptide p18-domain-containing protein [Durotheca rogersii]KAI5863249.1 Sin3 associated polypeptide p18-domain-containing protein [Durotheca rogersii]